MPTKRLVSALAVLCTICVVAQAANQPSLRDVLQKPAAAVSTASVQDDSYGYQDTYPVETKEVCLQETEQKVCTWVQNCIPEATGAVPACLIGQYWT